LADIPGHKKKLGRLFWSLEYDGFESENTQ